MVEQRRDSATPDGLQSEPDFADEDFQALTLTYIMERLKLKPGKTPEESYKRISQLQQKHPEMSKQIDEAIDYACKEALIRWNQEQANQSISIPSSKEKSLVSRVSSDPQDDPDFDRFMNNEAQCQSLKERPSAKEQEFFKYLRLTIRSSYLAAIELKPQSEYYVTKQSGMIKDFRLEKVVIEEHVRASQEEVKLESSIKIE